MEVTQGFAGMVIQGQTYTDAKEVAAALTDACREIKSLDPVEIGSYRGFTMSASFSAFQHEVVLKGAMTHRAEIGVDARSNLIRIDTALEKMPQRLESVKVQLATLHQQQEATKGQVGKPFPREDELREKSARLAELDAMLNMDGAARPETAVAKSARPSVLGKLSRPLPPRPPKEPDRSKPKHRDTER